MEPVLTKKDFVRRYEAGEFGNRSPTWNTLKEFIRAKRARHELVHIRNRIAGGPTWYNVRAEQVVYEENYIVCNRLAKREDLYFSLMAPTERTVIQGEVQQSCHHLDLYYSTVKKPMRDALALGGKQVQGLTAKLLLEQYMDPSSLDHLDYLLNTYLGHVIEFSVYGINWGTIPNRNTVFWEVRKY